MSADRLSAAAAECRRVPGQICHEDDLQQALADWLDLMAANYAPYWSEPYAAPFVPVIEKAYRVADLILGSAS